MLQSTQKRDVRVLQRLRIDQFSKLTPVKICTSDTPVSQKVSNFSNSQKSAVTEVNATTIS